MKACDMTPDLFVLTADFDAEWMELINGPVLHNHHVNALLDFIWGI